MEYYISEENQVFLKDEWESASDKTTLKPYAPVAKKLTGALITGPGTLAGWTINRCTIRDCTIKNCNIKDSMIGGGAPRRGESINCVINKSYLMHTDLTKVEINDSKITYGKIEYCEIKWSSIKAGEVINSVLNDCYSKFCLIELTDTGYGRNRHTEIIKKKY